MSKPFKIAYRSLTAILCCSFVTSGASAYTYWTGRMSEIFSNTGNFAFRAIPSTDTP